MSIIWNYSFSLCVCLGCWNDFHFTPAGYTVWIPPQIFRTVHLIWQSDQNWSWECTFEYLCVGVWVVSFYRAPSVSLQHATCQFHGHNRQNLSCLSIQNRCFIQSRHMEALIHGGIYLNLVFCIAKMKKRADGWVKYCTTDLNKLQICKHKHCLSC